MNKVLLWNCLKDSMEELSVKVDSTGVYVFCFNDYPFYVGTAAKSFKRRLKTHKKLFQSGERTFLDVEKFKQDNQNWIEVLSGINTAELSRYVFVPGFKGNQVLDPKEKSRAFWNALSIYGGQIEGVSEKTLKSIELSLQRFLINYSQRDGKVLPNIPGQSYTFFGKQEAVLEAVGVKHDLKAISSTTLAQILKEHGTQSI